MAGFLEQLATGLQACGIERGSLLLAVSGGADSVALLRGTLALRDRCNVRISAAHLNHNLRGNESLADVEWIKSLASQFEIPLVVDSQDIASIAEKKRQGIEATAREVRYAFLQETARKLGCSHVCVAHTADDQAETILHHVIRGTGLAGLCGMRRIRPLSDDVVLARPLLEITRSDVEAYLAEISQDYRSDLSNTDNRFTRNRLRNHLLPMLEQEYNPQIRDALRRLGLQAGDVQKTLEELAARLLVRAVVDSNETICRIACEVLRDLPRHLIRECFALLWKNLKWPRQRMGFAEWDRLAELVLTDGSATLPANIEATRRGELLVLRRR